MRRLFLLFPSPLRRFLRCVIVAPLCCLFDMLNALLWKANARLAFLNDNCAVEAWQPWLLNHLQGEDKDNDKNWEELEEKVSRLKKGLDRRSCLEVDRYLSRVFLAAMARRMGVYFNAHRWNRLLTKDELDVKIGGGAVWKTRGFCARISKPTRPMCERHWSSVADCRACHRTRKSV